MNALKYDIFEKISMTVGPFKQTGCGRGHRSPIKSDIMLKFQISTEFSYFLELIFAQSSINVLTYFDKIKIIQEGPFVKNVTRASGAVS